MSIKNTKHKKKVVISVINDLTTDQRIHKVALSLMNHGYEVMVIGRIMQYEYFPLKRDYKTLRFKMLFKRKAIFYITFNIRLFFFLLFVSADIFLSNDTDTLLANYFASKIRHKKLVFDAHEMFPEMPELVNRKIVKAIWTNIEDKIFPKIKYSYTVCNSIASIYNNKYGMNMQVIRNMPFTREYNANYVNKHTKQVILYQGAVNVGRGLERLIEAVQYLDNTLLYIAGDGDIVSKIKKQIQSQNIDDKVILLGRIPLEKLPSITEQADLGICLLDNLGLNYYYSLPNRIFDFVQAEVPILASDFPEIHNILTEYAIGELILDEEPRKLAEAIRISLEKWKDMDKKEKSAIFERAKKELCWEKEEVKLLEIISA